MTAETVTARVDRGVALLNDKAPGWRDKVRPHRDTLSLANPWGCVLSHVYGGYSQGVVALFGRQSQAVEAAHGFEVPKCPDDAGYRALTAEWRKRLES